MGDSERLSQLVVQRGFGYLILADAATRSELPKDVPGLYLARSLARSGGVGRRAAKNALPACQGFTWRDGGLRGLTINNCANATNKTRSEGL